MVYESASPETRGAGAAAATPLPAPETSTEAVVPERTAFQTSACFWLTAACSRTLGWTIVFAAEKFPPEDQRPCSTQKTSRGSGSAPTGTIRSLPMMRSCLPPLTSSPEEKEGAFAAIDENELIDARSVGIVWRNAVAAIAHDADAALFADDNFAGSETFLEGEEMSGVIGGTGDDGEDADVFVSDGVEQAPVAVAFGRVRRGRRDRKSVV